MLLFWLLDFATVVFRTEKTNYAIENMARWKFLMKSIQKS